MCLTISGESRSAICAPCVPSTRHEIVKLDDKRQSLRQRPYDEKAVEHYNKAVALHLNGSENRALAEYAMAIQSDPRMREALLNRSTIFIVQQQYEKAADSIIAALKLSPDDSIAAAALAQLAVIYDDDGQDSKAEELYRELYSCPVPKTSKDRIGFRGALVHYAQLLGRQGNRVAAKRVNARISRISDKD